MNPEIHFQHFQKFTSDLALQTAQPVAPDPRFYRDLSSILQGLQAECPNLQLQEPPIESIKGRYALELRSEQLRISQVSVTRSAPNCACLNGSSSSTCICWPFSSGISRFRAGHCGWSPPAVSSPQSRWPNQLETNDFFFYQLKLSWPRHFSIQMIQTIEKLILQSPRWAWPGSCRSECSFRAISSAFCCRSWGRPKTRASCRGSVTRPGSSWTGDSSRLESAPATTSSSRSRRCSPCSSTRARPAACSGWPRFWRKSTFRCIWWQPWTWTSMACSKSESIAGESKRDQLDQGSPARSTFEFEHLLRGIQSLQSQKIQTSEKTHFEKSPKRAILPEVDHPTGIASSKNWKGGFEIAGSSLRLSGNNFGEIDQKKKEKNKRQAKWRIQAFRAKLQKAPESREKGVDPDHRSNPL